MKTMWVKLLLVLPLIGTLGLAATGGAEKIGSVVRLDPALDGIVPTDATIEKIAGGFISNDAGGVEGPVWIHKGFLLFSDIPVSIIYSWIPGSKPSIYLGPKDFPLVDPATAAIAGTNGLTLDKQGRLTICDQGNRRVVRREDNGSFTVLADRFEGKRLNSPNDLVYKSDGALYFTDPPYALAKEDRDPRKEQTYNGVYRVKGGKVQLLVKDMTRPNGIAFSPDEKFLYVSNSEPSKFYNRFAVNPDGTLGPGALFCDMNSTPGNGFPDGMKVDQKGNVYGAGVDGLWIISPQGKHLGTIHLPEVAANCGWGDGDARTLYITASTGVYRIRLKVPGIRP